MATYRDIPQPGDTHWLRYVRRSYPETSGWVDTFEPTIDGIPASIVKTLGDDHISYIRSLPNPAGYCRGRARGWWDANDLEYQGIYLALAERV
jgi:hypothetical protein